MIIEVASFRVYSYTILVTIGFYRILILLSILDAVCVAVIDQDIMYTHISKISKGIVHEIIPLCHSQMSLMSQSLTLSNVTIMISLLLCHTGQYHLHVTVSYIIYVITIDSLFSHPKSTTLSPSCYCLQISSYCVNSVTHYPQCHQYSLWYYHHNK